MQKTTPLLDKKSQRHNPAAAGFIFAVNIIKNIKMKTIEIKNFTLRWYGGAWIIYSNNPKMSEYIYLSVSQLLKVLKAEGISVEEFDKLIDDETLIKFSKVTLLATIDDDGNFVYDKFFEPDDFECCAYEIIVPEIKE